MEINKKKVMVGMSGGVDSSVAAYLLSKNYDICGVTLKLFEGEEKPEKVACEKTCCSLSDVLDAKQVCRKMGVDHFVFNFKDEFGKLVINKFIKTYISGGTPNPCIDCNRYVKFYKMMERALTLGFDYIATGHYAIVEYCEQRGRYLLKKAKDLTKDQSYVLYTLTQDELSHLLLPLGGLEKTKVREIADENGFVNAHKPDSQDICFVPDGDYSAFIKQKTGFTPKCGDFIDLDGNVLGKHKGLISYTTGQRKGLGIAYKYPLYVIRKDLENNKVIVGSENQLYSDTAYIKDFNFISCKKIDKPIKAKAKTRYRQAEQPCTLFPADENGIFKIIFDEKQRAITQGQAAVLYEFENPDIVLGGGTII